MWSRFTYTVREMWVSLRRNLTLTVAAIITAAVSLFLFGLTLLIQESFDNQLSLWTGGVEMIVYIENDATPEQIAVVQEALSSQPSIIEGVRYCDVRCSYDQAQKLFAGDPASLQLLTVDNVPSFFSVVPIDKDNSAVLLRVSDSFKELPKVRTVAFPDEQIAVLSQLRGFVGVRTFVMSGALLFVSVLLIWNTIRTAMFARRREIEVMKLVGATNWFIRIPFMLEGLLQGVAGAAVASGFLLLVNNDWTDGVQAFPSDSGLGGFVVTSGYPWTVVTYMLVLGALVGAIGSATAASRFLDV